MTEQTPAPTAPAAQPSMQKMTLTPEQVAAVKSALTQQLIMAYREFCQKVISMAAANIPAAEALRHFDTGFLWYKEGIQNLQAENIQVQPPTVTPPAPAPATTEASTSEAQAVLNGLRRL